MIPNNACPFRITAAAGTELAGASFEGTVWKIRLITLSPSFLLTGVYNPKAFILHAASLGQAFAHCPRFLAAASRRSRGRVSVPFWLVVLSDQLPVTGLVGRYLTNYLIGRRPLRWHLAAFLRKSFTPGAYAVLALLSKGYPPPLDRLPTRYSAVCH